MNIEGKLNLMIDLETLSLQPDAAIIAIGATTFASFDIVPINFMQSCGYSSTETYPAFHYDAATIAWWEKQPAEARKQLDYTGTMHGLVYDFHKFLTLLSITCNYELVVWSNGANFDIPILEHAFRVFNIPIPWSYRNVRCYRTLAALFPEVPAPERIGTAHRAIDDAINQAVHAEKILSSFGAGKAA